MATPMSEQRRPTIRLGKKKDPRADSVPPSNRKRDSLRGAEIKPVEIQIDGDALTRERADAGGDIDELLGRLLARATQAELRAQQLEQTVARMNEERAILDARLAECVRHLDEADTQRAALEAQLTAEQAQQPRRDSPVTLAYVRQMTAELLRAIDRIAPRVSYSDIPTPHPPSDLPTPRSRSGR
jgi:chromosome segregation ATPase